MQIYSIRNRSLNFETKITHIEAKYILQIAFHKFAIVIVNASLHYPYSKQKPLQASILQNLQHKCTTARILRLVTKFTVNGNINHSTI